jgi:dethiobiotin synthetase
MADDTIQLDLIDDIIKGNFNNAEKALHQTLAQKQNDVLDQEKIKMAGQIFNNVKPEDDEEVELSDEEIENALTDDETEDESEETEEDVDDESSDGDDDEEE